MERGRELEQFVELTPHPLGAFALDAGRLLAQPQVVDLQREGPRQAGFGDRLVHEVGGEDADQVPDHQRPRVHADVHREEEFRRHGERVGGSEQRDRRRTQKAAAAHQGHDRGGQDRADDVFRRPS